MTKRQVVALGIVFFIDLSSFFFFLLSSLSFNLHFSLCFMAFFLLLLIIQAESVCFSLCCVCVCLFSLQPSCIIGWLHISSLLWPGIKHCKACSDRHANAHWYRHFRATSAYSSHCMEGKHCEPFMCFVFQCTDYWGVHGLLLIFLCPPPLFLITRGHLPHLFVTTEQEHDSSKIRAMRSGSLMGQKMKTVMAVL